MILIRARLPRLPRLSRHLGPSSCHSWSVYLIQRGYSTSLPQRGNGTPRGAGGEESIKTGSTHVQGLNKSLQEVRQNIVRISQELEKWTASNGKHLEWRRHQGLVADQHQTSDQEKAPPPNTKPKTRLSALKKKLGTQGSDSTTGQKYIFGQSTDVPIRTRFAPSPTGYLHLGSLRTALFNNLLAKATKGGEFIIRIEDTDQNRLVPDAEERVFDDLRWAGLEWTEGPDKGGPYAPYRQSERLQTYKDYTQTLLDNGSAYRCFCSHDTIEANARAAHDAGLPTGYPGTCRSLPAEESNQRAASGEAHVIRLNSGKFGRPSFQDAIYGPFQKKQDEEDFVLMKTDGYPTYHLANVVDDHLMKITHVVRGEEWLISTPKHIALYEAFGWQPPTFAHLGLLVDNDGSKLSKRNASVDLSTYRRRDIFPLALQAWLANLGSSFRPKAPTARSLKEVADNLSFKFTRGGIKLNPEKLQFFQNEYISALISSEQTTSESTAIQEHLIDPLVEEVLDITRSASLPLIQPPGASLPWQHPLELVSAMQTDGVTYTKKVLLRSATKFNSSREMARLLPYLFWRPPLSVYRASLATYPVDIDLFDTIHRSIQDATPDTFASVERDIISNKLETAEKSAAHTLLRLILVGDPYASSRSTQIMFDILGRDECLHRTSVVRSLLAQLETGGKRCRRSGSRESSNARP